MQSILKRTTLIASLAFFSSGLLQAQKPNVVVFFMDDMGYADLGSYGAKDVRTPHLDRLAREGVRLTDCYAAGSLCTPTRAALMTGRYQHRVGIETVLTARDRDKGLSSSEPTLPRYLKNAGYATGLIGKWHLGWRREFHPNAHGFDEFFGFLSGAVGYYSHQNETGEHDLFENDKPVELKSYLTDEITNRAVSFIERHANEPFFLDVAYNATHWPFEPPGLASPAPHPGGTHEEVVRKWAAQGTRQDYDRMLERADEGIGRILAAVDRLGLRNRTFVIFTNDNGGEWLSRMGPLFHRKGTLWEGGLRVPCILRWPGRLPAGRVSHQPAITMDFTATILAAANVTPNGNRPLDGIDLVPVLAGTQPQAERTFFWLSASANPSDRAVRHGRWKYISQSTLFPGQLFDMRADPGERSDLAAKQPDLLKKLKSMHADWERSVRAPRGVN